MSERVCSVDSCFSPHHAKGFCGKHYLRNKAHGDLNRGPQPTCNVLGCDELKDRRSKRCPTHQNATKNGWTPEMRDFVFEMQGGICAIEGCLSVLLPGQAKTALDHDHDTMEPRAILCGPCNSALGWLREDPERIKGLARYAEQCQNVKRSV